jgi:hypothetical protein
VEIDVEIFAEEVLNRVMELIARKEGMVPTDSQLDKV